MKTAIKQPKEKLITEADIDGPMMNYPMTPLDAKGQKVWGKFLAERAAAHHAKQPKTILEKIFS